MKLATTISRCSLCAEETQDSGLVFHHLRQNERVSLEITLCNSCGQRIEKHLKRAIPKRLMTFEPVLESALRN